jgi:hypothetical protein
MSWTAPMTAVSGDIWTSAQFNAHVRDNLLETMPGKATAANRLFVSNGLNSIAERVPSTATVATSQTTSSTSYANLTTVGPEVTVTTGTAAAVWAMARMEHSSSSGECAFSVAVSGATTISASDNWRGFQSGVTAGSPNRFGVCHFFTGLTAGSNTFTMKYKTSGATATFSDRDIIVIPL